MYLENSNFCFKGWPLLGAKTFRRAEFIAALHNTTQSWGKFIPDRYRRRNRPCLLVISTVVSEMNAFPHIFSRGMFIYEADLQVMNACWARTYIFLRLNANSRVLRIKKKNGCLNTQRNQDWRGSILSEINQNCTGSMLIAINQNWTRCMLIKINQK